MIRNCFDTVSIQQNNSIGFLLRVYSLSNQRLLDSLIGPGKGPLDGAGQAESAWLRP